MLDRASPSVSSHWFWQSGPMYLARRGPRTRCPPAGVQNERPSLRLAAWRRVAWNGHLRRRVRGSKYLVVNYARGFETTASRKEVDVGGQGMGRVGRPTAERAGALCFARASIGRRFRVASPRCSPSTILNIYPAGSRSALHRDHQLQGTHHTEPREVLPIRQPSAADSVSLFSRSASPSTGARLPATSRTGSHLSPTRTPLPARRLSAVLEIGRASCRERVS